MWLAATAVASTVAFDFFLLKPIGSLTATDPRDWVALAVFLVAALSASTVADLARRAAASDQRRRGPRSRPSQAAWSRSNRPRCAGGGTSLLVEITLDIESSST
jgi:hypothetical protein